MLNHFSDDEYFHLPDVQTLDGLLDLISGCTLAILGNVLDFRTYCASNQANGEPTTNNQQLLWKEFDRNNIPADERMAICYARGVALQVFQWIRVWCIVKAPDGGIIHDLPSKYLVHVLNALLAYKSKAEKQKLEGAPHCALWMLKAQVQNVVQWDTSFEKLWDTMNSRPSHSLMMTLDEGCTVQWKENAPISINSSGKPFLKAIYVKLNIFSISVSEDRHDSFGS